MRRERLEGGYGTLYFHLEESTAPDGNSLYFQIRDFLKYPALPAALRYGLLNLLESINLRIQRAQRLEMCQEFNSFYPSVTPSESESKTGNY
jgi:hypothetical protein